MAETALGMATTLVGSALRVASSAAKEEMSLLLGVHDHIWFISDELKMMQAFLRAADGARENIGVLKAYSELIRDLAYDIEDSLEEFMVFVKNKSLVQQLLRLRERHRIAVRIRTLKLRVQEVSQRNTRYNAIKLTPSISTNVIGDTEFTRNFTALNVEEAQLVGLDEPKKKLMELIGIFEEPKEHESSNTGPRVVSLVGMGGIGKTTVTKKVFDSKDLSDKFGTRAWITVSQSFDQKEIFKEMVKHLFGAESLHKLLEDHQGQQVLEVHLADYLSKRLKETRYLIVLDDVWTIDAWNRIKVTFQDSGKDDSCVVVTTRNQTLAKYCSPPSHIHQPDFLGKEEARTLFLKKTNRSLDELEKGDKTKGIVEKILNKCGGLPLAILTIGAVLANKDTEEWENIYMQLPWDLANNPSLDALRRVVSLSYNHLPSHLKPCFLHLSIFPEDFEIEKKHLVNRWVAEGLVADDTTTRTLEEVAENYFYELISRSLIQPSKLDNLGNVKTCTVHDIVHDIAVSISRQENYAFIHGEHTSNISTRVSIRHLSYVGSRKLNTAMDLRCVRSLTAFSRSLELKSLDCSSKFKMLRILDLKHAGFEASQQDIKYIGLLLHLKYLHYPKRINNIYALPKSIGNLLGLQTLDLQRSSVSTLPTEITKLHNLRSLRCSKVPKYTYFNTAQPVMEWFTDAIYYLKSGSSAAADLHMALSSCWSNSSGIKLPKGVGKLKELQILEKVDIKRTSRKAIKELGELTQLRKIIVRGRGVSKKNCKAFCETAPKLCSLRSLNVSTKEYQKTAEVLDMLVAFTSPLPSLERLKLKGLLQKIPDWVGKCEKLVKVDLKYCQLKELEALAELPNLVQLRLKEDAFNAENLVFRKDGFPKLRILLLKGHYQRRMSLPEVTFEQSTTPNMETIDIEYCDLATGINGIKHLPKLKKMYIWDCRLGKQDTLQKEVENHMNHPVLHMRDVSEPGESTES